MTKKNELNIEEIKKLIPHRYPFLLIDKLIDIIPKESAVGVKNVTFNENFFKVILNQCLLCLVHLLLNRWLNLLVL